MKNAKILVGSRQFMEHLKEVALAARESFYVQAMTFEGDAAGEELIDIMIASPADDKRLLIDSFSKVVISDSFVFGTRYLKDSAFRREITQTRALIKKAEQSGVKVQFTNPVGWLMSKYPLRNHKKMMIADDEIAFLGGINFSDHNFEWHDIMVQIGDNELGHLMAEDFRNTWLGKNQSIRQSRGESDLWFLNGIKSQGLYADLFDKISSSSESVTVISPYVSEPLMSVLKSCSDRGVNVQIVSPSENNKSLFGEYVLSEFQKGYFSLRHYPGMFHLKGILIDNNELIIGSSNYDLISYYFEQEIILSSRQDYLIQSFVNDVLNPILDASREVLVGSNSFKARIVMNGLAGFCRLASGTVLRPK
ncbi:MAG: phosphatidylserine/phosphatidylglycerophosphate/cardiolipin synthase family protein [Cyclobacteriaceae bacterium]